MKIFWVVMLMMTCAVCGFSVGIMWPGTFSIASASIRGGGTAMFALLALAGDLAAPVVRHLQVLYPAVWGII